MLTDEDRLDYALELSRRTREGLRSLPPSPKRTHALSILLGLLADFTPPRGGAMTGRRTDPALAIWRERRAEMQRLRSMMNPTTGAPYTPVTPLSTEEFQGWLHYVQKQKLVALFRERKDLERHFKSGSFTEAADRREAVQVIADDLRLTRLDTAKRYQRWRKGNPDLRNHLALARQYTALRGQMDMARAALDRLAEGC